MKIGVIGAGQLGRMLALSGYPLGHQFGFISNTADAPASLLGYKFKNTDKIQSLTDFFDVITYESENTQAALIREISQNAAVYPSEKSLFMSQNRGREKLLFEQLNIPSAPYQIINCQQDLQDAVARIGTPAILKTLTEGYDGKGQFLISDTKQISKAWESLNGVSAILEGFIDFKRELSLIAVRGIDHKCKFYPLVENIHHLGILRQTIAPAQNISKTLQQTAQNYMQTLLDELGHIGVLSVELFETNQGDLIVNEIAPRVHNSGHWSIEGAHTSQFENHVRAISNMPLGSSAMIYPFCAMVNIISKIPKLDTVLNMPSAHLHLYDKTPRPDRKLGHITITATSKQELDDGLGQLQDFLP